MLKPCIILVTNREEVVWCVNCVGECRGVVKGVLGVGVCWCVSGVEKCVW